jgi:hypothetical protein
MIDRTAVMCWLKYVSTELCSKVDSFCQLLMHFKPFWMPCLHIRFFNSRVDCSRKLYEKMKWNSGILVRFQKSIQIKKSSYQTWLESIDQKCGEKSAYRIRSRVSGRSQAIKISFFYAAAPQNSFRKSISSHIYMLSDWNCFKNILIGQISSHRWCLRKIAAPSLNRHPKPRREKKEGGQPCYTTLGNAVGYGHHQRGWWTVRQLILSSETQYCEHGWEHGLTFDPWNLVAIFQPWRCWCLVASFVLFALARKRNATADKRNGGGPGGRGMRTRTNSAIDICHQIVWRY